MRDWRTGIVFVGLSLMGSPTEAQERIDMRLADAGFIMREANTPEKMSRLKAIPPRQILARTKNGVRYYVYADPDYCQCAMVGTEKALQDYRTMRQGMPKVDNVGPGGINTENEIVNEMPYDGGEDIDPPAMFDILDLHYQ